MEKHVHSTLDTRKQVDMWTCGTNINTDTGICIYNGTLGMCNKNNFFCIIYSPWTTSTSSSCSSLLSPCIVLPNPPLGVHCKPYVSATFELRILRNQQVTAKEISPLQRVRVTVTFLVLPVFNILVLCSCKLVFLQLFLHFLNFAIGVVFAKLEMNVS